MEALLVAATHSAALAIEAMALLAIAFGSAEAFVTSVRIVFRGDTVTGEARRAVWMRYARWLVAGLTFQLAADIVDTAIAPTWNDIGRLGAIAVIRTFLNFFLERDMGEVRGRQHARGEPLPPRDQA